MPRHNGIGRNVGGNNFITPSQDQGACQASTAFAVTAAMNAKLRTWYHIPLGQPNQVQVPDLSAGDLFYCGGGSCSAGLDVEQALAYATDKGVVPAYDIPYNPAGQTCGRGSSALEGRVTKISMFVTLRTVSTMKDAIQSRGPIIATLRAYQDLKDYKGGVYRYNGTAPFLYVQTVTVIGFTTDGWLCKNSWGANWGMAGVFCIAYGECGIDDETMWEISGFTATYPIGTVTGTPAVCVNKGVMHILYRDNYGQIQDLSGYPPSATQPFPLDGLAAGVDPCGIVNPNSQVHVVRTDILGWIQDNFWDNGWSKVQWLTGPQGFTAGPPAAGAATPWALPNALHVFYRDADGNIHDVIFRRPEVELAAAHGRRLWDQGPVRRRAIRSPGLRQAHPARLLPRHRRNIQDLTGHGKHLGRAAAHDQWPDRRADGVRQPGRHRLQQLDARLLPRHIRPHSAHRVHRQRMGLGDASDLDRLEQRSRPHHLFRAVAHLLSRIPRVHLGHILGRQLDRAATHGYGSLSGGQLAAAIPRPSPSATRCM
jgi:hypothetical protein